jgi:hypothetical protein
MVKESIKWMTRRGKFKASCKEFAEVCGLDYVLMKGGVQMKSLPELEEDEARRFHKFDDFKFMWSKGLRREAHLLNGMLRCTMIHSYDQSSKFID